MRPPLGLSLARAARVVSRAFDEALGDAGGSLPMWLILLNLKIGRAANQLDRPWLAGVQTGGGRVQLRAVMPNDIRTPFEAVRRAVRR